MLKDRFSDQHAIPPFLNLDACHSTPVVVEAIEAFRFSGSYLVRARSSDGAVSVATCNVRSRFFLPMLKGLVIPAFLGRDVRELETLVNEVYIYENNYKYQGTPFWNCVAYVEAALFDLLGRISGRSVGVLLGGPWRDRIPVYLSSMRRDTTADEEVDWINARVRETEATAVKMKIGGRMRNNADSLPGRTEQLIARARETFGAEATLYVDGNGSYDRHEAVRIGRILEQYQYSFFEEPCPFEQYEETRAVTEALEMDVAGGEQDCNLGHMKVMIRDGYVNVIQPDMMYNGGIIRALRVARMAAEAGIPVTPHSPKHNPELATLIHFASVVRNTGPYLEYPALPVTFDSWYSPAFEIERGGYIRVPDGPGLGVEYDGAIWERAELC